MSVEITKRFATKENAKEYMDELIYELESQLEENKDFGDWFACEDIVNDIGMVGCVKGLIDMMMQRRIKYEI